MEKKFESGSEWIRCDFHLHTKEDREFKYEGKEDYYVSDYIDRLETEGIGLGIITNHNKFVLSEFKTLKKEAQKKRIFLHPGVELSVNDGNAGLHCLIVFDYRTWFSNGTDYIEHFLGSAFEGIANRENENTSCNLTLDALLKKLEEHHGQGRDSFIIMAHVHQSKGFLEVFEGARIQNFAKNELFNKYVLGFQKFRNNDDRKNLNTWLKGNVPAFVEDSDGKSIEETGRAHRQCEIEKKCFLKIGDGSFHALQFALRFHDKRLAEEPVSFSNTYIKKVRFLGGNLDGQTILLNHDLNCLIGVRGSGKSTLFEMIRAALGEDADEDKAYKLGVIKTHLGSGGVVYLDIYNPKDNKEYAIKYEYDKSPKIFDSDNSFIPNLSVASRLKMQYYGQKDLSRIAQNEINLIEKLATEELDKVKKEGLEMEHKINSLFLKLKNMEGQTSQLDDLNAKKAELNERLQVFRENKIDEELKKERSFGKDMDKAKEFKESIITAKDEYVEEQKNIIDEVEEWLRYKNSELTNDEFKIIKEAIREYKEGLQNIKAVWEGFASQKDNIDKAYKALEGKKEKLEEQFAETKRKIKIPNLSPNDYLDWEKELRLANQKIEEIKKIENDCLELNLEIRRKLNELQNNRKQEYTLLKNTVDKLNAPDKDGNTLSIHIDLIEKGDKKEFINHLDTILKGTGIGKKTERIANSYRDPVELYDALDDDKSILANILSGGDLLLKFREQMKRKIENWATFRVKDKISLKYKKRDLSSYSLGQKASALILFILAIKDIDLVMIDQPEDDLDNQSIYKDLILELIKKKNKTQFIFATHNPNIPVLGDCEQVVVCQYSEENKFKFETGSIDKEDIQTKIVDIMEGGKDAFNRRKNIYTKWKR